MLKDVYLYIVCFCLGRTDYGKQVCPGCLKPKQIYTKTEGENIMNLSYIKALHI